MWHKKSKDLDLSVSKAHLTYLKRLRRTDSMVTIFRVGLLLLLVALWEAGAAFGWIDPFITSSPSRIVATLVSLFNQGVLFMHIFTTLYETVIGFLSGTLLGVLIAVWLWWSPFASRVLDPYLVILNALPKIALGPIIIVWIGAGPASIITMVLLISLIVTIMGVYNGFREVSPEKVLLLRSLGASKRQILTMVVLPASIPTIISVLKINVGMSWVGVIVGEFLVSRAGLGYLIVYGGQVFKLDLVMASIVILCVAAALMYYAVAFLERKLGGVWRSSS